MDGRIYNILRIRVVSCILSCMLVGSFTQLAVGAETALLQPCVCYTDIREKRSSCQVRASSVINRRKSVAKRCFVSQYVLTLEEDTHCPVLMHCSYREACNVSLVIKVTRLAGGSAHLLRARYR